jgi:hypothetical protein
MSDRMTARAETPEQTPASAAPPQQRRFAETGLRSPSRPLERGVRRLMETCFGRDFGAVRVHADARAARSAAAVDALAYTVGQHIVFATGQYRPGSAAGRALLAHELAHTLQQGGTNDADGLGVADANGAAEHEAEQATLAAAQGRSPQLSPAPVGIARQRAGDLKAIRHWSYVAYEKEVRLVYYEAPPKTEEDPYAEAEGTKKQPIQIGTIPWVTNNPGNITVDPKAEARRQAASVAAATLPAPGSLAAGPVASMETLQTVPYRIGATGTFAGRYAVFPTSAKGRDAILPYLRAIARFRKSPNMTVAEALKTFKGQEKGEGPEVKEKYVQDIRAFMVGAGVSAADVDALMSRKVADVLESEPGVQPLVGGLMRKEGALARPGVVFNCNGFVENRRSLYDAREWGLIQALKSSLPANDELRGILGCK